MVSVTYLSVHGLPWRNTPGSCSFSGDPQETNHGYQCRTATGPTGRGHSPGHNCQLRFSQIIWNLMKLFEIIKLQCIWNLMKLFVRWNLMKLFEIWWNWWNLLKLFEIIRNLMKLFEVSWKDTKWKSRTLWNFSWSLLHGMLFFKETKWNVRCAR